MSQEIDPETREKIISLICADEEIVRLVRKGTVFGPPPGEEPPYDPDKNHADPDIGRAMTLARELTREKFGSIFDPWSFEFYGIFLDARQRICPRSPNSDLTSSRVGLGSC